MQGLLEGESLGICHWQRGMENVRGAGVGMRPSANHGVEPQGAVVAAMGVDTVLRVDGLLTKCAKS